jgi:K+ transporter
MEIDSGGWLTTLVVGSITFISLMVIFYRHAAKLNENLNKKEESENGIHNPDNKRSVH